MRQMQPDDRRQRFWSWVLGCLLVTSATGGAWAQGTRGRSAELERARFRNGSKTLQAFVPAATAVSRSVVKLDIDGTTVALGAVIDGGGWVLTKASELRPGSLTAWLAGGKEVSARAWGVDEENDLALVRVDAPGLQPVVWGRGEVRVGQWTMTPGIEPEPQAVGIVSSPVRKIQQPRALIGVQLDLAATSEARITDVLPGLGAAEVGLRSGDVIMAVNAEAVRNRESLITTLRGYRAGDSVRLRVRRAAEEFELDVPLRAAAAPGSGRNLDRQERMNRMGSELSRRAEGFSLVIQHDTVLQAWQCGGPLLDLNRHVLGINIARAGRVATYALPAETARRSGQALLRKARAEAGKVP